MSGMFAFAIYFKGDISKWDESRATDKTDIFMGVCLFNGDISDWDVSGVVNMDLMFWGAVSFKHKLRAKEVT